MPPIISARGLLDALGEVTLIDVRWELGQPSQRPQYEAGHIPGAVFVELETELSAAAGRGGRHPLPAPSDFEAAMRRAGVSAERPVVVYDAGGGLAAARAWWLLRYFGHEQVSVLDGGLAAWSVAGGGPLESGNVEVRDGDFVARAGGIPLLDAASAGALAGSGVLLDARAPERFTGESEPIDPIAGHIPGARNRPTTENLGDDGCFRPASALRDAFARHGVHPGVPVGAYCGSGVTAAHEVLALELVGIPGAALYAGSWSEWITDPERPIATGK